MLSRFYTMFLLLMADFLPLNAAILKGVIIVDEVGGRPMGNVEVGAAVGTNATVSDSLGIFTLEFPQMQPGETVRVLVNGAGYVVVNWVQLDLFLPKDPDANPLQIIICKKTDREEMARRFYQLKGDEAVEATYQQKLKALDDEHRADAATIAELQQERDQAKAAAERASAELAKNQPGQTSEIYQEAERLFLDGKIDEAIKLLDDEKLRQSVTESKKTIEDAVKAWLLKAQLLNTQFRFDEAENEYQAAIQAVPDSFEANFAYARFSHSLNRFEKARATYTRCLEWAKKNGRDPELARTLNNLGILDWAQNRIEEARKDYGEALQTFRELALKNPEVYLPFVAQTLNNLGNLERAQSRMEEASKDYEEALQTFRELAQKNLEVYLPFVAQTLNNLGNLESGQKRMEEARKDYEEALQTFRELAQKNLVVYLPYVAQTLNNLGILDSAQGRMQEARKDYEEALKIRRTLAQKNPVVYLPDVARTLNNLGILDSVQNRMQEARKEYEEALQTFRELAQKNPVVYLPDVAQTLNNLGDLDRDQNRIEEARKDCEEALKIYESFAKDNPERFSADVTRVKELLAKLPSTQGP